MAYITTEVEVDLDEFSNEELLDEIELRGISPGNWPDATETTDLLNKMYEKVRLHQPIDEELRDLFWRTIGRSL
jgi:hypothetical protein